MAEPVDRLSALLERFRVRTQLFHAGGLSGHHRFEAEPGRGFLHVLHRGEIEVRHRPRDGLAARIRLARPSLLLYPRAVVHDFHSDDRSDVVLTCAALRFEGGERNPVLRALPGLIQLPLDEVEGLGEALSLLFAESTRLRCGQRLLADRLFEVVLIQLLRWLLDHPDQSGVQQGLLHGLSDPALARALVSMHEAPGASWDLPALAARAGLSRSAFAARFRAVVGQTPADYLADWRVSLAQTQLREGRALKQITHELGYANSSALSRLFRQKLGMSPSEWLRSAAV
ncbi:MAG: AraC family transcriptional regulator [Xanthomonadales bacterium]|nr:AraC family transcriptional regulator [Xanthomonadales bacterium]